MRDHASGYAFALTGLVTAVAFAFRLHDWLLPVGGVCWAAAIILTLLPGTIRQQFQLPAGQAGQPWVLSVLLFVNAGMIFKRHPEFVVLAIMAFVLALVQCALEMAGWFKENNHGPT